MANLRDKGIQLTAKGFNLERRKLYPPSSSLIFLTRGRGSSAFEEVRRFNSDFILRYDRWRNQTYAEVATTDNLRADLLKTPHFAFLGAIYVVGEADIIEPFGDRFSWQIYGTIIGNQRYEAT